MSFSIVVSVILCSSILQTVVPASFFYPDYFKEVYCTSGWTQWFNSAKPSDNRNYDRELLAIIRETSSSGSGVCKSPQAMQAQSLTDFISNDPSGGSWFLSNNAVVGFQSSTPLVDFQVRFCCLNTGSTTPTPSRPIPSNTCGRADIKHSLGSSRIFGGSIATPNSWPWQVLLSDIEGPLGSQTLKPKCGGTLIDSRHVLTAAHCVNRNTPATIMVTTGVHNRNINELTAQLQPVARIIIHPAYNPPSSDAVSQDDIAILQLVLPVQFNRYVQPACLPGPDPLVDADVVLIGWGAVYMIDGMEPELKQAKVKVIGQCNRYWSQVNEGKQICVGNRITGSSACRGDSGGPMLLEHNGQWVVAGVASYVSRVGCTTFEGIDPNVYTRVSYYLPWILSNM